MNRLVVLIFIMLFAFPALAQDDDGGGGAGGGFDVNDLFGNEDFGPLPPKVDPLVDVRNSLLRANAPPLEKKQESPVKKVYEKELKALGKPFEQRFGVSLESALASQAASRGRRGS